ncbi:hypothetical protein BKA65DRAFT_502268 [Rhexocercosporidium sp. MPI-PUGE-AT-0058]|nr:hypothetical protein BKA65DRAFT_502268 [Rhexocercosporidium sp. MPI-PUGE-AT-0058]
MAPNVPTRKGRGVVAVPPDSKIPQPSPPKAKKSAAALKKANQVKSEVAEPPTLARPSRVSKSSTRNAVKSTVAQVEKAVKAAAPELTQKPLVRPAKIIKSAVLKRSSSTKKAANIVIRKPKYCAKKRDAKATGVNYAKVKGEYSTKELRLIKSDLVCPTKPHPNDKGTLSMGFIFRNQDVLLQSFNDIDPPTPIKNRNDAVNDDNGCQLKVHTEDMELLVFLVISGIISCGRGISGKDFKAITDIYNRIIRHRLLGHGLEPKKYLPRGWNNLHSVIHKKKGGTTDDLTMNLAELNFKYANGWKSKCEDPREISKAKKAKAEKVKAATSPKE